MFKFFSSLIFSLCVALPCLGATTGSPAYRLVEFRAAVPAMDGFMLSFIPDEEQCKKAYGKRWRESCAASIGMPGKEETKLELSPHINGSWRWLDGNTLSFTAAKEGSVQPNVNYTLDLSRIFIPASIRIDGRKVNCITPPRAAKMISSEFWIDPAPGGTH